MEITRVKIGVCDGADRVKADASMTLDHCFIVHGLRLTPQRKRLFSFYAGKKAG